MKQGAGKEFHTKTTRPHQMWATDASYFRVSGWVFYYMVTVMDDFSRYILSWKLQRDMTSDSFIEVVRNAVDLTGMIEVRLEDRTRLLSDNGPGYVSRAFRDYLHLVGIRHILASPIVAKLQLAALSRIDVPEDQRRDYYLYADEFHRLAIIAEAFEGILAEARKFRLSLTIGHQYLDQLDEPLRNAIFGNTEFHLGNISSTQKSTASRALNGRFLLDFGQKEHLLMI